MLAQLSFPVLSLPRFCSIFKKQPSLPMFLQQSNNMTQREKFNELNELEADRIHDGLENPQDSDWSLTEAMKRINRNRNRYSNVFPWDQTRVKLPVKDTEIHSDYINASRVRLGLHVDDKEIEEQIDDNSIQYIACQGPLPNTTNHFWSMCFNLSVDVLLLQQH
ncbi:uncharacterized protein J8A68_005508 [[Candida] subhashii]|uniref:Tyrosine-protein phosphatase domain-containing protein n=1 Tax=[Candida] subhashii TaxID=561895 RepID=A0A8J5QEQ1_9ASCO|nr:uncharacterized protein J8A68_005508 [[Candida] subhashii]KAG7660988.1 hypothetical protein J8A68_005508 [[Candida] subhashii]